VQDLLAAKQNKEVLPALVRANFGRTIIKIMYGINVRDEESEYISLPEKVLEQLNEVSRPGQYLVDLFPSCNDVLISLMKKHLGACDSETHP
jgi:hypothetical protein